MEFDELHHNLMKIGKWRPCARYQVWQKCILTRLPVFPVSEKYFFLENQLFCKKVEISQKSEENHQNRNFDMVTGVNWILEVIFHKFHEFC